MFSQRVTGQLTLDRSSSFPPCPRISLSNSISSLCVCTTRCQGFRSTLRAVRGFRATLQAGRVRTSVGKLTSFPPSPRISLSKSFRSSCVCLTRCQGFRATQQAARVPPAFVSRADIGFRTTLRAGRDRTCVTVTSFPFSRSSLKRSLKHGT